MSDGFLGGPVSRREFRLGLPAARLAALAVSLTLGACANGSAPELSLGTEKPQAVDIATASAGPSSQAELEKATAYWGEQNAKNPRDGKAAIAYAKNLKALGRKAQALSVLQASYMFNGDNREYLSEYGRLALENGQVSTAGELLSRADDPAKPDWRVISARGTVLAKQGSYKEAIGYFERALALAPGHPSLLNNLAMAYTMDGQATRGEELLRQAAEADPRDTRLSLNLALVRNLQGKSAAPTAAPAFQTSLQSSAPVETTKTGRHKTAIAKPMDPDTVIRTATAAEQAKSRQQ